MIYRLRRRDGTAAPASSGTLVGADGTARHLARDEVAIEPLATWRSPHSGARYPARWRVLVPAAGIALELSPLVADQELQDRALDRRHLLGRGGGRERHRRRLPGHGRGVRRAHRLRRRHGRALLDSSPGADRGV